MPGVSRFSNLFENVSLIEVLVSATWSKRHNSANGSRGLLRLLYECSVRTHSSTRALTEEHLSQRKTNALLLLTIIRTFNLVFRLQQTSKFLLLSTTPQRSRPKCTSVCTIQVQIDAHQHIAPTTMTDMTIVAFHTITAGILRHTHRIKQRFLGPAIWHPRKRLMSLHF